MPVSITTPPSGTNKQHQTFMAGVLACKTIVNNLIGHTFACLAFCQEGLYGMPCSGFQPVQPVGWKLGWPGRWARMVGVAVHVLPPEVGVAPLSAWARGWAWLSMPCLQRWAWPAQYLGKEGGRGCPCPASRGGRGPLSACLWPPALSGCCSQPSRQDPSNPKGNLEVAGTSRMPHPSLVVLSVLPSSI